MTWKNVLKIIAALMLFVLLQNICLIIIAALSGHLSDLATFINIYPEKMAMALIVSGCMTSLIIYKMGMVKWPQTFFWNGLNWQSALLGIMAALTAILASNMLGELLDLPDMMELQFESMAENFWGILALAIVGPVVEELLFREGIQGFLTRKGVRPWNAMLSSALLFGVIHMNPAQIPFAFIVGFCLSIIYHKTQSITLTSIIHILNNGSAVLQINLLDEKMKDAKIAELLGLDFIGMCIIITILSVASFFMFRYFWKNASLTSRN